MFCTLTCNLPRSSSRASVNLTRNKYHYFRSFNSISKCQINFLYRLNLVRSAHILELLKTHGDIESNPGPGNMGKLLLGTYNIAGCKNYSKLKRIMAWLFKLKKADRFIYSLQETHIGETELNLAQSLWREGMVASLSNGHARGVLTVFSNSLFNDVIFSDGSKDGRSTWLVGTYNTSIEMFISIYSPNSGKNAEFYTAFFCKVNELVNRYKVDNVYISGDFNLVLYDKSINRTQTRYEKSLCKLVLDEIDLLGLKCVNSNGSYTWNRGDKYSTLDYIFIPKESANTEPTLKIDWAVDRSDHACVQITLDFELDKGKGMFRPNLAFLESSEHRGLFEAELFILMSQTNPVWDPHTKLEFAKVMIRTKVAEFSIK